jgi:undecaprenyl-diphosphatase
LLGTAAKPLAVLFVLLGILLWAVFHMVRFALRRGVPLLASRLERLQTGSDAKDTRVKRIASGLLDPSRPQYRAIAVLALLLVGAAWLFLGILEDVINGDPLVRLDSSVFHALQAFRTASTDSLMIAITELGDTSVVTSVTAVVFLWLVLKRNRRTAVYWVIVVAGASLLNTIIKVALHRPRPSELFYTGWSAFSFPSGHSTVNLVLYGFLAFLIVRELNPLPRLFVALGAAIFVILIAFSRLYLGAHWFSDVVGGLAFGSVWLTGMSLFYMRGRPEPVRPVGLLCAGCIGLLVAGGVNVHRHHALDVERYAVANTVPTMAQDAWWSTGWQQLPNRRVDLTGELREPFTVQWAGSLSGLEATLLSKGWQRPVPWTSLSSLGWLTETARPSDLPAAATFANGRLPSLILIHQNDSAPDGSRFVLRVWPADLELTDGSSSAVWIGSVVEERLIRHLSFFTWASSQSDMNTARDMIAQALPPGRLAQRTDETANTGWDGRVLLLREPR